MKLFAASKYALVFSIALFAVPLVACYEKGHHVRLYCALLPYIPKIVFQFEEATINNDIGEVRRLIKEHLLKNNADINNILGYEHDIPLHLAALMGRAEIVQLLIDEGKADINRQDRSGKTPMHQAVCWPRPIPEHNKIGVLLILLKAGASFDPRDDHGRTAAELLDVYITYQKLREGRDDEYLRIAYCMREMIKIEQKRRQDKKQRTKLDIAPLDAQNIITRARQFADRQLEDQLLTPRPQRHNPEMLSLLYGATSGLK